MRNFNQFKSILGVRDSIINQVQFSDKMVRKTSRKRKAKVKTSPTRDRKRKNDENEEFVDEFVQSSDNERQANEIEIEIVEDTTDSFECANENGKFLCSVRIERRFQ